MLKKVKVKKNSCIVIKHKDIDKTKKDYILNMLMNEVRKENLN